MNEKKLVFSYINFPFDKLSLDSNLSNIKMAKEGDMHINTFILDKYNKLNKYNIDFNCPLKTYSISYYIGKADPTGKNPSLYFHPILHPRWTDKDQQGKIKKTISNIGQSIEDFWIKMRITIEELLNKIDPNIKAIILGPENSKKKSDYITDVVKFPLKNNLENTEQSKSFGVKLFCVDDTDQSKKYNQTIKNDHIKIPDTKWKIFTQIYDLTEQSKVGRSRILDYEDLKFCIYNPMSNIYTNASNQRLLMTLEMVVSSPVLHTKGRDANLQITAQKIAFSSYNIVGGIKEIPINYALEILKRKEQAREEYGDYAEGDDNGGDHDDSNNDEGNDDNKEQNFDNGLITQNYFDQNKQQQINILTTNNNNNHNQQEKKPKSLIKEVREQVSIPVNQKDNYDDNDNKLKKNNNIQLNKDESLKRKLPNDFKENNDNVNLKKRFKKTSNNNKNIFDNDQFHSQLTK